ncbi:hypothetical protein BDF20DRAFT_862834 [Mycotypha africana]|uniref:uncharacterized protein n=1 Tax=Mycotypha africana TaxID=64632 RepID=UPI0023000D79|nr:uncharacterized protein BDF20DRAFT_862834 [Mycotypha africana]KAI8981722.1 hypothetical protein BDF20DRAFT_862834 [Mycotypha africana]
MIQNDSSILKIRLNLKNINKEPSSCQPTDKGAKKKARKAHRRCRKCAGQTLRSVQHQRRSGEHRPSSFSMTDLHASSSKHPKRLCQPFNDRHRSSSQYTNGDSQHSRLQQQPAYVTSSTQTDMDTGRKKNTIIVENNPTKKWTSEMVDATKLIFRASLA